MVIGSGGIAMEFVGSVHFCDVIWVSRRDRIGSSFLDKSAAAFLIPFLFPKADPQVGNGASFLVSSDKFNPGDEKSFSVSSSKDPAVESIGPALGPDWVTLLPNSGAKEVKIDLELDAEVVSISWNDQYASDNTESFPLHVLLTNGNVYECDLIISATGVIPNTEFLRCAPSSSDIFQFDEEGAIMVNELLQAKLSSGEMSENVFAAGDCCSMHLEDPFCWFQMRLWSQATVMGRYAAHCMLGLVEDELGVWINFEIFSHITNFFGQKVILLGKYDARGLKEPNMKIMMRVKPGDTYVKVVLQDGRVVGAVLIGETDLEETMENLILNQLNVEFLGDDLLREDVDLEDYFD
eukprot:TRINITY_DN6313_c0_g1_i1.p1 TRINITY_DN6313_c0_g1~~TRINITY_DN6313_c0_g1_i1.p1  ORF type:complete len:351 (-),score=99.59 TRINITY_DN6313_c0_g1_i1:97-1149(-)